MYAEQLKSGDDYKESKPAEAVSAPSIGAVYSKFGGAFCSVAGVGGGGGIANWIVEYDSNYAGTFIVDISSNVCGAGANVCIAIEREEFGIFFRAFGLLAAYGGMALSIVTAEDEVVQLVNPGGM